jgi:hypothetical protein
MKLHLKAHLLGVSLKKIRETLKTFKGLSTQAMVYQKVGAAK